jgi:hypothetical protein
MGDDYVPSPQSNWAPAPNVVADVVVPVKLAVTKSASSSLMNRTSAPAVVQSAPAPVEGAVLTGFDAQRDALALKTQLPELDAAEKIRLWNSNEPFEFGKIPDELPQY